MGTTPAAPQPSAPRRATGRHMLARNGHAQPRADLLDLGYGGPQVEFYHDACEHLQGEGRALGSYHVRAGASFVGTQGGNLENRCAPRIRVYLGGRVAHPRHRRELQIRRRKGQGRSHATRFSQNRNHAVAELENPVAHRHARRWPHRQKPAREIHDHHQGNDARLFSRSRIAVTTGGKAALENGLTRNTLYRVKASNYLN